MTNWYERVQFDAEENLVYDVAGYDEKGKVWQSQFMRYLPAKEQLPRIRGHARALDLGCNTGYNVRVLEEKYGWAEGVDINKELIKASRVNSARCQVGRIEKLPYDDNSFCVVCAKDILEHSNDPDKALAETYRVLVDGGYLVAMIPLDGENTGADDITNHPQILFNNQSHIWKATMDGVFRRLVALGYTDLEYERISHEQLFGHVRPYGDSVLLLRCRKDTSVKRVPFPWMTPEAYWAAFLTLTCNGNCQYCIQKVSPIEFKEALPLYAQGELPPKEWVEFYNSLQRNKQQRLSIIGGEPTNHYGFFEIVNGIEGYYKTITTNLASSAFNDVDQFASKILDKNSVRINTSFHPHLLPAKEFADRIHKLRWHGFFVDQIAMVDHPMNNFKRYYYEFLQYGIHLQPQTYLGRLASGELVPNDYGATTHHTDTLIDNYGKYAEACGTQAKNNRYCMTTRFMAGPDGQLFKCHYHLYSRMNPLGNILDDELPELKHDFEECSDFGWCNPCDYGNFAAKGMLIQIPNYIRSIVGSEEVTAQAMHIIESNIDIMQKPIERLALLLYQSVDPMWDLYHNEEVTALINDFIAESDRHVNILRALNKTVFMYVKPGVNLLRILTPENFKKFVGGE